MKLYRLNNHLINLDQICKISLLPGSKCGAPYDEKDKNFVLISLSSGEFIRLEEESEVAEAFISYINQFLDVTQFVKST